MKKALHTLLWMFAGYLIGLIIFAVVVQVMTLDNLKDTDPPTMSDRQVLFARVVDWMFPTGLPVVALGLGVYGRLPGTREIKAPPSRKI